MKRVDIRHVFYRWDKDLSPVMSVKSGETVCFETMDCFSEMFRMTESCKPAQCKLDSSLMNPLTGPIYISEAEPGDVLAVHIEKIQLKPQAIVACSEGAGVLGSLLKGAFYKYVPITGNNLLFTEKLSIPLKPMVGVVGVTPFYPISTRERGEWGGNMDNNKICEGSILYLPVQVKGALLAIGDIHAAMGDGEMSGFAMESGGCVTVKVDVLKEWELNRPALLNKDNYYTIATAGTAEEAIRLVCQDMFHQIKERTDLTPEEISMLMTSVGNIEVCAACSPNSKTFRFSMPAALGFGT